MVAHLTIAMRQQRDIPAAPRMPIRPRFPEHQVRFYHVTNRPFGQLPVVPIGSFNVVSRAGDEKCDPSSRDSPEPRR